MAGTDEAGDQWEWEFGIMMTYAYDLNGGYIWRLWRLMTFMIWRLDV